MAGIFLVGKIYCCWVLDESFLNMWGKFSFYFSFYNSSSCVDTYINIWERKNKLYLYWLVRGNSTRLQSSSSPFWGKSGRMFYRVKKRWIEICPWLCLQQANGQQAPDQDSQECHRSDCSLVDRFRRCKSVKRKENSWIRKNPNSI